MNHTLIFDIGKTNKKVFLFNEAFQLVYNRDYKFEEIIDEDSFACDDIWAIQNWVLDTIVTFLNDDRFSINAINFTTYGASWVHVGYDGSVLAPLYNYLKPVPSEVKSEFYSKYGPKEVLAVATASPPLDGMLNAGLQLYWLKYCRAALFEQINFSLHLPQYLSYLLTGRFVAEYTNIGCHTMMWDYSNKCFHQWVYDEGIDRILPSIQPSNTKRSIHLHNKDINIGVGIHDSSACLLSYLQRDKKKRPFVLLSTGTWSICLNPFNRDLLQFEDLENDCLLFLQVDGHSVKASRLFLGEEHRLQVIALERYYNKKTGCYQAVRFDDSIFEKVSADQKAYYSFIHLASASILPDISDFYVMPDFEYAYHQLIWELVKVQKESIDFVIGASSIELLYIDGGFSNNELFHRMLEFQYKELEVVAITESYGSAAGAAMAMTYTK